MRKNGGFVINDKPNEIQNNCYEILEDIVKNFFEDFFIYDELPERRIIANPRASYNGMAKIYSIKAVTNNRGLKVRYRVGKIYLKTFLFEPDKFSDALATYSHEMCHMFGGDSSAAFSQALTFAMEILLENSLKLLEYRIKWQESFV